MGEMGGGRERWAREREEVRGDRYRSRRERE